MKILLFTLFWALLVPLQVRAEFATASPRLRLSPNETRESLKPRLTPPTIKTTPGKESLTSKLLSLKTRGLQEIDRRLTALNKVKILINSFNRLSSAQKTQLTISIDTQITSLSGLRSQIDSATDPAVLRSQVKSIAESYRIFALYLPQIHLLSAIDKILNFTVQMPAITAKVNAALAQLSKDGREVGAYRTTLTQIQSQVDAAAASASAAQTLLLTLTPEGFPANKSQLEQVRNQIKSAQANLKLAHQQLKTLLTELKLELPKPSTHPRSTPFSVE